MSEFLISLVACFLMAFAIIGGITVGSHIGSKGQCEETYNVNHCERNLTYTPTYPEVTND